MSVTPARRAVAEALGTGLLVAAVVGSGIMAARLAGDPAVALLCNTIATGAALVALILAFGPISGAHFNPVVTLVLAPRDAALYLPAQIAGAIGGAVLANAMFDLPLLEWSATARAGSPLLLAEAVATFGLVGVIIATGRRAPAMTPFAVAAYIVAAYWFTSSTSFANPAVTIGRACTDTYAGIRPSDVPAFVAAQAVGGIAAAALFGWLTPQPKQ
jgi:glycerol uptake facilitator-like aquaporin